MIMKSCMWPCHAVLQWKTKMPLARVGENVMQQYFDSQNLIWLIAQNIFIIELEYWLLEVFKALLLKVWSGK